MRRLRMLVVLDSYCANWYSALAAALPPLAALSTLSKPPELFR